MRFTFLFLSFFNLEFGSAGIRKLEKARGGGCHGKEFQ